MNRIVAVALAAVSALLLASCGSEKSSGPEAPADFLKWSMDRHKGLKSYKADVTWIAEPPNAPAVTIPRRMLIEAPNRFRITVDSPAGDILCVSDGKQVVQFMTGSEVAATDEAGPTLLEMDAATLQDPMMAGSPIYAVFGGSERFKDLAPNESAVTEGPKQELPGQKSARSIEVAHEVFGKVVFVIEEESGLVRRIRYEMPAPGGSAKIEEKYSNVKVNEPVDDSLFVFELPKGVTKKTVAQLQKEMAATAKGSGPNVAPGAESPLVGQTAPDFTLADMDGKHVTLRQLKGKPILIDFWATWCGPCINSMPHTEALAKEFGPKGLQVLAVTNEQESLVKSFVAEQGWQLPVFRDEDNQMNSDYGIHTIPTLVLIDAEGKVVSYLIGARPEAVLRAELKKVGL